MVCNQILGMNHDLVVQDYYAEGFITKTA